MAAEVSELDLLVAWAVGGVIAVALFYGYDWLVSLRDRWRYRR